MKEQLKDATYTKIRKSDTWGLRVVGPVTVGEIVLAKRRGDRWGTRKEVTAVVAVYDGVYICEMKDAAKAKKSAPDVTPAPEAAPHAEGAGMTAESGDSEDLPF